MAVQPVTLWVLRQDGKFLKLMLLATSGEPRILRGVKVLLTHNGTRAAQAVKQCVSLLGAAGHMLVL